MKVARLVTVTSVALGLTGALYAIGTAMPMFSRRYDMARFA